MLSRNPSDNTNMTTEPVAPLPTSVIPEELCVPVIPDKDVDVAKTLSAMLGTDSLDFCTTVSHLYVDYLGLPQSDAREMVTPSLMYDYSPFSPDMNPYLNTPQDSTKDTPLFNYLDDSQMLTSPLYSNAPLFPMFEWEEIREPVTEPKTLLELDPSP